MALDQCAAVYVSENAAMLALYVGGVDSPMTHVYYVYGDKQSSDSSYTAFAPLPGIAIHGIIHRINNPAGKHTTFTSSGNRFSRIASIIQAGYTGAVSQASISSGVRFRWTAKDLLAYSQKWKNHLQHDLKQTNAECEEALRFASHRIKHFNPCTDYFTFLSDTQVEVVTGAQLVAAQERARARKMEGKMVNF